MTTYDKKQMEKILKNTEVKTPLEALGFPGLNCFYASDHKFDINLVRGGAYPLIRGTYKYNEGEVSQSLEFTIENHRMELKQ